MLTAAGTQIGLDHKEATRAPEGRGPQPAWVWLRAGCLEEGASEQQIRPRVHPPFVTCVSGCLGFPFYLCPLPTPGTLTSGWATGWNLPPGVTRQTELWDSEPVLQVDCLCSHLPPSWPAWAGPPISPCSTPNPSTLLQFPKKASVPGAWMALRGWSASPLPPAWSLFPLWV